MSVFGGSECGPVNPMMGLMKQFGQDRSLQQDRYSIDQKGESSKLSFRTQNTVNNQTEQNFTEDFFRDGMNVDNVFQLNGLHHELELIHQPPIASPVQWHNDFLQHNHQTKNFDVSFKHTPQPVLNQGVHQWHTEFEQTQMNPKLSHVENYTIPRYHYEIAHIQPRVMVTAQPIQNTIVDSVSWEKEFEAQESRVSQLDQQDKPKVVQDNESLAKTAAMILDAVNQETNEKFKNSQFMSLMRKLKDKEVTINSENQLVENTQTSWANEFQQSNTVQSKPAPQEAQEVEDDWLEQYKKNFDRIEPPKIKDLDQLKPNQEIGFRSANPVYQNYSFQPDNPYLNPLNSPQASHHPLADSILATEAKLQLNTSDAAAWEELGLLQQENERDDAAIAALRQAVKHNPALTDAWLALAVSYTNENCRTDAYDALEQWISYHPTYHPLIKTHSDEKISRHAYITHLFLEAARSSPNHAEMDPDVQVGLGVLFNVSEEYDKAIDCFQSALMSQPDNYLLWNKLGATLANAKNAKSAVEAYEHALAINPSFVRARYNLAISSINLGRQTEAAEHLLTALKMQQSNDTKISQDHQQQKPNGMSDNVWGTLRLLMINMNRSDLAKHCEARHLNAFHSDFNF